MTKTFLLEPCPMYPTDDFRRVGADELDLFCCRETPERFFPAVRGWSKITLIISAAPFQGAKRIKLKKSSREICFILEEEPEILHFIYPDMRAELEDFCPGDESEIYFLAKPRE